MTISLLRLILLYTGLTLLAIALTIGLSQAVQDFLIYAHNIPAYPGFAGFPA
ncbi:MAG: hypothetical protein WED05_07230 [Candidatus Atabeyarchaeum deiterrae]|jgi:hypothetical protein